MLYGCCSSSQTVSVKRRKFSNWFMILVFSLLCGLSHRGETAHSLQSLCGLSHRGERGSSSCPVRASHCPGFPCCGARVCRQLQQLWSAHLVAPWHVTSSWTRDRTYFPYTGRRMLYHWTTRKPQTEETMGFILHCFLSYFLLE